jgi:desulfoferrodoxin (superoxide reductase-like protein)
MKQVFCFIVFAFMMLTAALSSCSDSGGISGGGAFKDQKFYSAAEPGRWESQAADHDVSVKFIEDAKGTKGVEVSVPFARAMSQDHYVEAIALMDGKNREIAIKRFKRGEKAEALFAIPAGTKYPLYVVSRCNMHDMWRKKITGTEKPAGEEGTTE